MDDKSALEDIRNEGTKGYTVLYSRYIKLIRCYVFKYRIPESDVDDLLQEIFHKFFKNILSLKEDSKLLPYLYKIAKNVAIDYLHKGGKEVPSIPLSQLDREMDEDNNYLERDAQYYESCKEQHEQQENQFNLQRCLEQFFGLLNKRERLCLNALKWQAQGYSVDVFTKNPIIIRRMYRSICL
ncbi:RNA polymerase sigma factor RpoE, partial [Candidatus Thiomargarita nelsonii]